ncbi:hypothetical protein ONS95_008208 [Cadophora gregata]|uniref:uncharacterized protein n=1 Tax=Cadophora gregata TaxID=51156 RepID=UPI0026DAD65C|nr:uncharacterized protein ONS95_008208 [Cadophora gregata]KAK0126621.1 hypothetical protein ONS95_008208 [Cadophora gregata]
MGRPASDIDRQDLSDFGNDKNKENKKKGEWTLASAITLTKVNEQVQITGDKPIGLIKRAMRAMSLHSQQLFALNTKDGSSQPKTQRVYVHCIRHAEAQHNLKDVPYEYRKKMKDPRLTVYGELQAKELANRFRHMEKVTHIICSPLQRTIHTTQLALGPAIFGKGIQIIAYPDVREWGNTNCNTGIPMSLLLKKFPGLEGKLETRLAPNGWEMNREIGTPFPEYKQTRALKVRKELWELGQVALKEEKGIWNGIEVNGVARDCDVHIVVVSHGAFLATLEGEENARLYNAEYKSYEFATEEMVVAHKSSQFELIETEESKQYIHTHPVWV